VVDRLLDERALKRQVAMSLPYHLAVPAMIADTDMIATLSERIVHCLEWPGVRAFPVPLDFPRFHETMLWHRRNDNDPGQVWLRGLILSAGRALEPSRPDPEPAVRG
jgi:DNA-binding transcriptional LysR family regulator